MEIYVIRHTKPDIEKGICYGQTDISVARSFEIEWKQIKQKIPLSINAIYSSPLSRCLVLASKLSLHYQLPIIEDARLKELNFGEWELKKWNDINQSALQIWMNDYVNIQCPGGESYAELAKRIELFYETLQTQNYANALIVTHHGVMKAMHSILKKVDLKAGMDCKFEFGEIIRMVKD